MPGSGLRLFFRTPLPLKSGAALRQTPPLYNRPPKPTALPTTLFLLHTSPTPKITRWRLGNDTPTHPNDCGRTDFQFKPGLAIRVHFACWAARLFCLGINKFYFCFFVAILSELCLSQSASKVLLIKSRSTTSIFRYK